MGKIGKSKRSDKRKQEKARRKAAKAALYRSFAEKGKARKASEQKTEGGHKHQHLTADCGNVGCIRCYPHLNNYMLKNGKYRLEVA